MSAVVGRLVVVVIVLVSAALLAWVLGARTRRRATIAVASSEQPTAASIIAFHAAWCGACAAQRAQLDALDGVAVRYVNVERDLDTARRYGVRSLPTTIVVSATGDIAAVNHGLVAAAALRSQLLVPVAS